MKTLTVLVLVQTGVLLLLFGKIIAIEKVLPLAEYENRETPVSNGFNVPPVDARSSNSYSNLDEAQLRTIIREEFETYLAAGSAPGNEAQAAESSYTAENQYQADAVMQQLDYFESVGRISEMEMQNIQIEIAKLHKSDRRQMLNRLIRTMNAGDVKGHL